MLILVLAQVFDATVTVGNVLTIVVLGVGLLGVAVWYFGSRHFAPKVATEKALSDAEIDRTLLRAEMEAHVAKARADFVEKIEALGQQVHTDYGRMENGFNREMKHLNDAAGERYNQSCKDFDRIERTVLEALSEARTASRASADAVATAQNTEKNTNKTLERMERILEGILARGRHTDGGRS